MKFAVRSVLLTVVVSAGLVACTSNDASPDPLPPATSAPTVPAAVEKASLSGAKVTDSFGNVDFYTTVDGDTLAEVADTFELSAAKLAQFNGLLAGATLEPGTKLRLIPAPGPAIGAKGPATEDAAGIPTSYQVVDDDTLAGITYRFGITENQLAEANKVPYVHEQGNTYFIRSGHLIQLQKNPVDSRSGTGATVNNSFGQPIFYTTVDGDSFDSLGYKFRSTTEQLLMYNPSLSAGTPIPAGTKVRLIPGELPIDGARGTFTADADGIPLSYTTAAGDTERQVSFRFSLVDIRSANRPLTGTGGTWYEITDPPTGELVPGQTISLALNQPINR
ncbi:LysM repeat protein [Pseudarthrobacter sp. PvP004]|uniref:lytic transglycosylase n=1 Tax=Pseudarthrobacter sp. PvP004 TaxID=2817850 RepID=UPI001AE150F9|nr:LysM peptidoglycan-binding domain-containing protein [Pseudarthrobacter sp. PvP004]MBP2267909.1 LysM repeat protein [Pseudarthrobacter sp. PvP004]